MRLIENLKWRYATKKFDASKKLSQRDIDYIKEAIQLSPSSYGLQPFKVLEINNPALRAEVKPIAWNQTQITDASHLFVFCNNINVTDNDVDDYIQLKSEINKIPVENILGYGNFVKGKLKEKTDVEMLHWTAKQTYIALSNAMNACAELQIDSTPVEGFESDRVNELLHLSPQGLNACVLLAIGYRATEDVSQHSKKVRKPIDVIFNEI